MLCNANPRNKRKNTKTKEQRTMVTKGKAIKYKDHVRKRLLNNVKTENMLLLDKVKLLELDLFVARSAIA